MITHVVLFKLMPEHKDEATRCRDLLMALPATITQIKHYEIGLNMVESPRAYDFALISKFESLPDLEAYQVHADHQVIVPMMESIISVDYENE